MKNYFYPDDFRELPIKKLENQDIFIHLVNILQFLYSKNYSSLVEFFDRQILDSLVYELYFSEKFKEDGLNVNLAEKVQKHLEPIEYNRWADLEFKDDLTEAEQQEKAALEKKNMEIIERVYRRLKEDKEILAQIERIKAHERVRVVEGEK